MADEALRDDTGAGEDMDDEETGTTSPILTDEGEPIAPVDLEDAEELDSDPTEEGMAEDEPDEDENEEEEEDESEQS